MNWGVSTGVTAALLLLLLTCASALELPEVDEAAFSALVEAEDNVVALFSYTNDIGCAECRVAEAEVAALAAQGGEEGEEALPCSFVVVDCEKEAALCRDQGFHAVPAILLFSEQLMVYEFQESFVSRSVLTDFVAK